MEASRIVKDARLSTKGANDGGTVRSLVLVEDSLYSTGSYVMVWMLAYSDHLNRCWLQQSR